MRRLFILIWVLVTISQSYGSFDASSQLYQANQLQQSSSFRSSSFSSQRVQYQYENEWPDLYQVPLFRQVCQLGSGIKSNSIKDRLIGGRNDFDYYSLFSDLYRRNNFFQSYIFATTGVRVREESDLRRFFSIVSQQPGGIFRSMSLFARHPNIFKSELVNFALTNRSRELLQFASSRQLGFVSYESSFREILRSRYYRNKFAGVLGCGENDVYGAIQNAFTTNSAGTLLLVKHVISRRTLFSRNDYFSANYNGFIDQSSIFRRKTWRRTDYYSSWSQMTRSSSFSSSSNIAAGGLQTGGIGGLGVLGGAGGGAGLLGGVGSLSGIGRSGIGSRQATIQQTTQVQEQVHEHEAERNVGISGSQGYDAAAGYAAAERQKSITRTTTTTTTTTINYQEQWPELYQEPLFQDICHLQSNFRSRQITQQFLPKKQYNYERIFSNLYRKNRLFQSYIFAATGIQETEFNSRKFFGLVQENPGSLLRMVSLFAKHPTIFKHDIANLVFTRSSAQLIEIGSYPIIDDDYLIALTSSQTYRKLFASVFGCGIDGSMIRYKLRSAFGQNKCGTLLLIKHVLTRRSLFSYNDYMGLNIGLYRSKHDFWGRKRFRHNTYFGKYFMKRSRKRSGLARVHSRKGKKIRKVLNKLDSDSDSS